MRRQADERFLSTFQTAGFVVRSLPLRRVGVAAPEESFADLWDLAQRGSGREAFIREARRRLDGHSRLSDPGVEVMIASDLLTRAIRQRILERTTYDVAVLLAGDESLASAVAEVVAIGHQVLLLAPPHTRGPHAGRARVARKLQQAVSAIHDMTIGDFRRLYAPAGLAPRVEAQPRLEAF